MMVRIELVAGIALVACLPLAEVGSGLAADSSPRVTADYLAEMASVPFYFGKDPCDPKYEAVVKRGVAVVPDLIALLDDATMTQHSVCLFGGHYAIGDIAMSVISDIIEDVPWLGFITQPDDPRIKEVGFTVYWEYVRASRENRRVLKEKASRWFEENAGALRWRPDPDHPAGGVYYVKTDQTSADG